MGTSGAGAVDEQGYALLIAASPAGRHAALDAGEALPALAAATPAALLGTRTGSVVQLAEPSDPNTVLAQLRTAAAHPGPLLVYVAGRIVLDPRRHRPHLTLPRSTPRSVRYTGVPWRWFATELGVRPPGSTTVVADLVADAALWQHRAEHRLAEGLALYGALAPPPPKRASAALGYSRALASVLRAVDVRPAPVELHRRAVHGAELAAGTELFETPETAGAGVPGPPALPSAGPGQGQGQGQVSAETGWPAPGQAPPPPAPATPSPGTARDAAPPGSQSGPRPGPQAGPEAEPEADVAAAPGGYGEAPPADGQAPALEEAAEGSAGPSHPPRPPRPLEGAQAPAGEPVREPDPAQEDPHAAIYRAVREGRHGEAVTIASAWETAALRASGPASPEAVHWVEVRADLAYQAGDPGRACTLWLHASSVRLDAGQSPRDAEVAEAVDRAHHCWQKVTDPVAAHPLGVRLAELRGRVPGRRPGALQDVTARLASLAGPGTREGGGPGGAR